MNCPICGKNLTSVLAFAQCVRTATIDEFGTVIDFGRVENIYEPDMFTCPFCHEEINEVIKLPLE